MMTTFRQRHNFRSRTLYRKEIRECRWRNVFNFALARLDDSLIQHLKDGILKLIRSWSTIYGTNKRPALWLISLKRKRFRIFPSSFVQKSTARADIVDLLCYDVIHMVLATSEEYRRLHCSNDTLPYDVKFRRLDPWHFSWQWKAIGRVILKMV